jgi:hypothetical protein
MKCSLCKKEGHIKTNKKFHPEEEKSKVETPKDVTSKTPKVETPKDVTSKTPKKLLTEDLGKKTEYALCLLLNIPYVSKSGYKYSIEEAEKIKERLSKVKDYLTYDEFTHTGESSKLYDFTGKDNNHLSVKTNKHKNDWKICPQIIGQPTKKKFCEYFELPAKLSDAKIKEFITENTVKVLKTYFENSFHCPILYYNEEEDTVMIIKKKSDINWEKIDYKFSYQKSKTGSWNESTTVYFEKESKCIIDSVSGSKAIIDSVSGSKAIIDSVSGSKAINIGEFQVHTNRDAIKFRFCLKNLIKNFEDNLEVIEF